MKKLIFLTILMTFFLTSDAYAQRVISRPTKSNNSQTKPSKNNNTATKPSKYSSNKKKETGLINGHEWVDLGLPSGVKWATCNIGAYTPEEYGNYYAWGETNTNSDYTSETCGTWKRTFGDIGGNAQYDVARANWGESWRLPTKAEYEELINCCTWSFVTIGSHNGYKVMGPNGKSIFLPSAGYKSISSLYFVGEDGYYWTSSPNESNAQNSLILYFDNTSHEMDHNARFFGHTVRPVSK